MRVPNGGWIFGVIFGKFTLAVAGRGARKFFPIWKGLERIGKFLGVARACQTGRVGGAACGGGVGASGGEEQSIHFSNLQGMVSSVCVEPVGGCGMAGSEVDSAMIGGFHLVDDDVPHAVEFVGNDIKVKFVVHLQNHL